MLSNYFRIAFRNLRRRPGYAFINVLGLAIGLGAALVIVLYLLQQLSYDRFHEKANRIVQLVRVDSEDDRQSRYSPQRVPAELGEKLPEVIRHVTLTEPRGELLVSAGKDTFYEDGLLRASADFFEVFDFRLLAGDPRPSRDDRTHPLGR